MKISNSKQYKQGGFTIVELMIATMVFSTVLVVITFGILHFTNSYYKGVNSSTTQNTARSIMDGVAQTIQFSGSAVNPTQQPIPNGLSWFCAGYHTYVYLPGAQYDPSSGLSTTNPGLYVYPNNGSCPTATNPPTQASLSGGKELLGKGMRITAMNVAPGGTQGAYTVSIVLAYGDRDLLCSRSLAPTDPDSCSATTPSNATTGSFAYTDTQCRLSAGSQFCAVSSLSTTVYGRVAVVKLENKPGIL